MSLDHMQNVRFFVIQLMSDFPVVHDQPRLCFLVSLHSCVPFQCYVQPIVACLCLQESAQQQQQHIGAHATVQRKKRSTRSRAMPEKATGSLPNQAVTHHIESPDSALQVAENKLEMNVDHPQGKKRSARLRAVPDVVILDAVLSDSEPGEEEEGSDAEFEAMPKGSKKVRGVSIRALTCACSGRSTRLGLSTCAFGMFGRSE